MTDAKCEPPAELLPCPFCGGQASFTPTCYIDVVQCRVCGAQGMATMGQHEAAIVAWNRRITPPAVVAALVEALEGMLNLDTRQEVINEPVEADTIRAAAASALAAYREAAR